MPTHTGTPPAAGKDAHAARIQRETLETLAQRGRFVGLSYVLLLTLVLVVTPVIERFPAGVLLAWTASLALALARLALSLHFVRWSGSGGDRWLKLYSAVTLLQAGLWSMLTSFAMPVFGLSWSTVLMLVMTAGIGAGTITSLVPHLPLLRATNFIVLWPVALAAFLLGSAEGIGLGLATLVYSLMMWVAGKQLNREFHNALVNRLKLQEAIDQAEEATRIKSAFLANMSHEIRTPMHGVLGSLELLRGSRLSSMQRQYLATAHDSAEMALAVIDDILDFSKVEAGKLRLERLEFDLAETLESVAAVFAERAAAKGLELACYLPATLPVRVLGDPVRLRQVVGNLLSNATKFTEQGEVLLQVQPERDAEGRPVLRFEVRDTGIGIDPEVQGQLFQPFTQADESTTRRFGGTGLGLAICRQLVELMGGRIEVHSLPGAGSTFRFQLPLVAVAGAERPSDTLLGYRVLLAEPNATVRGIAEQYLKDAAAEVATVAGAAEALALLLDPAASFDVLVVDEGLRDADGRPLAERASALPQWRFLRRAVLTRRPLREDDELLLQVRKPLARRALVAAVRGERQEGAEAELPSRLGGRVLLVEDNDVNRLVAEGLLRRLGLRVETAGNGRTALERIEAEVFDLVLMDCQMPEMDGFTATRLLRERERAGRRPRLPVLALTANASAADRDACLSAGMDDFLSKPFKPADLYDRLARWLGMPAAPAEADAPAADLDLDPAALESLQALMGAAFPELVATYLRDAQDLQGFMSAALAAADLEAVAAAAHKLKGSSGNMGAAAATRLCQRLELAAGAGDREAAGALLAQLRETVARVGRELAGSPPEQVRR